VPTHEVGADTLGRLAEDLRVGTLLAALLSLHAAPGGGPEHPLVKTHTALTEGIVETLIRPGGKAVERDRDLADDQAHA
jgi:hypothetical protein